jgi:PAS domain S-box-containing protein
VSPLTQPSSAYEPHAPGLPALYRLLAALTRAETLDAVYDAGIAALLASTSADRAAVLTFGEDGVMRFRAWNALSPEYREALTGHSPWKPGTKDAEPIVVPDVLVEESLRPFRELLAREAIRSLIFVPMALERGVFGKLMLYRAEAHEFTLEEVAAAQAIAGHLSLAADRKRAEQARMLLAAIVENSDDAIIGKDLRGIITSWNRAAERTFGYTAAETIGHPVSMLAVPDRVNEMPGILHRIREGERVDHYETKRRRKDGQTIDVSLTVSPIRDDTGKVIGASKIARDITERKRAEKERVELLAREREARRTAELLNRVGPQLLSELDLQRLLQAVTDVATALVDAEMGAFFQTAVSESGEACVLYTVTGPPREAFATLPTPGTGASGRSVVRSDDITQDPRFRSEARLPAASIRSYLAVPVLSRSGEMLGSLSFGDSRYGKFEERHEAIVVGVAAQAAIAIDNARLFEQSQWVQAELKRSNEELRRSNQDLETFAYSASHDLQEPLRTIAISAQLLEQHSGGQLDAQASTFLRTILRGSQNMADLLRDLLAYTTATKHSDQSAPHADAAAVLSAVLENMKAGMERAGATVTFDPLPAVAVHEAQLLQLLQNLIGNALKYHGPEPPRVHVSAEQREGWWVFTVTDNGIGIDSRYADQIFGLFKRLHTRERYSGSGIGLAICQRIVEKYGGRIWLERSAPGEGSTFCFSFPA